MQLETKRLLLRELRIEDAEEMFRNWTGDPEVTKFMTWDAHESAEATRWYLEHFVLSPCGSEKDSLSPGPAYCFGIENKETGELMGQIDVRGYHNGCPVIGYVSGKRFWGNGYMTEAAQALIEKLAEDGYTTIVINAHKDNIGSNRVIQKVGGIFVDTYQDDSVAHKLADTTVNSYRVFLDKWAFGGGDPDGLLQLVLEGKKTATSSGYELYAAEGEPLPKVGAFSVIQNARGEDVCVIQNTDVTVRPYRDVPESVAWAEGEGDRTLAYWRSVHEPFFRQEYEADGLVFTEDSRVVTETFRLVKVLK